jgi:hypothetical protein
MTWDRRATSGAKEQAQQAAGAAAEEGKRVAGVAGVAQEEAKRVTSEVTTQLRDLLEQATSQVEEQSSAQKSRLAQALKTFGDDLRSMASEVDGSGLAAQVVQQVASAGEGPCRPPGGSRTSRSSRRRSELRATAPRNVPARRAGRGRGRRADHPRRAGCNGDLLTCEHQHGRYHHAVGLGHAPAPPTQGSSGPRTVGVSGSSKTAPIPPTGDDASPAYLRGEDAVGPLYSGADDAMVSDLRTLDAPEPPMRTPARDDDPERGRP